MFQDTILEHAWGGLGKTWKTLTSVPLKIQSTNQTQIGHTALSLRMILGQVNFMENSPS
jgi:hypothetical protein